MAAQPALIGNITAHVAEGDPGHNAHPDYAKVVITLANGEQVTLLVHQSKCYAQTINVEIDGDFTTDAPALRINLNDNLLYDSVEEQANPYERLDRRTPDLPEDDDEDEGPSPATSWFLSLDRSARHDAVQPVWSAYSDAQYRLGRMELLHAVASLREEVPGGVRALVALVDADGVDAVRVQRVYAADGSTLLDTEEGDELDGATVDDYLTGAFEKEALLFSEETELDLLNP